MYKESPSNVSTLLVNTSQARDRLGSAESYSMSALKKDYESGGTQINSELQIIEDKLREKLPFSFKKGLVSLYTSLKILNEGQGNRKEYRSFITHLRNAITLIDKAQIHWPTSSSILEKLSFQHFQIDLNQSRGGYDYFFEILPDKYNSMQVEDLNVRELNQEITQIYPRLSLSYWKPLCTRKLQKIFFVNWDPAFHSVRSKIGSFKVGRREVTILRMGCPIRGPNAFSSLDPIFISYLRALKTNGKKHLYINNQNILKKNAEKRASYLLYNLSKSPEFESTLTFITLPYNSSFYMQKNLGRVHAHQFIAEFKGHILNNEEGFIFPEKLRKDPAFEKELDSIFHTIHKTYFKSHDFLVQRERGQFVDLGYAFLARYLIENLQIDAVNWTCRHGIDRAMSSLAIFDALLQQKSPPNFSLKSTLFISYWPALAHYHRSPVTQRAVRMLSAVEKLAEVKEQCGDIHENALEPIHF